MGASGTPWKCAPRRDAGARCVSPEDCLTSLTCVDAKCAAPPGAGEPCTGRCAKGFACDPAQKKCAAVTYGKTGEACDSAAKRCERGSCNRTSDTFSGTCVAPIADGEACGVPGEQKDCEILSECINGKCQLPDPSLYK